MIPVEVTNINPKWKDWHFKMSKTPGIPWNKGKQCNRNEEARY